MTDQLALMLEWFANYSNFYSVISVLVGFCVMVVFILRLNGEHLMGGTATHYNVVKEKKMVSLHNPFSVMLSGTRLSSIKDGVFLDVSATQKASTCVYWGVNIQAFQKEISNMTLDIATHFREGKLFDNNYLHQRELGSISCVGQKLEVSVRCPDSVGLEASLGEPPRRVYPVVAVSLLDEYDVPPDSASIVAQFTVFHLKDSVCTLDSHIVYQFVKTNHNRILSLQPIFLVSSDPDTTDSQNASHPGDTVLHSKDRTGQPSDLPLGALQSGHEGNVDGSTQHTCDKCKHIIQSDTQEGVHTSNNIIPVHTCDSRHPESSEPHEAPGNNEPSADDNLSGGETGLDESNACIVCQSAVIFYTLLPCRHACVCGTCIKQLDRCPMCRGYIDAYFRLQDTEPDDIFTDSSETENSGPPLSRWQAINNRVNEYLGFS